MIVSSHHKSKSIGNNGQLVTSGCQGIKSKRLQEPDLCISDLESLRVLQLYLILPDQILHVSRSHTRISTFLESVGGIGNLDYRHSLHQMNQTPFILGRIHLQLNIRNGEMNETRAPFKDTSADKHHFLQTHSSSGPHLDPLAQKRLQALLPLVS